MDIIVKFLKYVRINKIDIKFIGILKIIDNDLMFIDYIFGFGSVVKFIGIFVFEIYLDVFVYVNNGIFILEIMGRDIGWLVVLSCFVKFDNKLVVDFIYFFEVVFDKDEFFRDVK